MRRNAGFAAEVDALVGVKEHNRFVCDLIGRVSLEPSRRADLLAQVSFLADRASDPRLCLAVLGEFSCGKSTFINAILRRRLLQSAHRPTTAAATYLSFGAALSVNVGFRDGSRYRATEADSQALRDRLADLRPSIAPDTPLADLIVRLTSDRVIASKATRVEIALPSDGLRDGLTLIDTPGIHAAGAEGRAHAAVTERVVREEADAAIVLIPADAPMTRSLLDFLEGPARPLLHRCLFVISKADHIPEEERAAIREFVATRLAAIVGRAVEVTESAALTALPTARPLRSHLVEDWERWKARFTTMEAQLSRAILRRRAIIIAERLARVLQDVLRELQTTVEAQRARLLGEEAELARNSVERLESALQQIDSRCRVLIEAADDALRKRIRARTTKLRGQLAQDIARLLDAADRGTMSETVKVKIPAAIEQQRETFAEEIARALRNFSRTGDEVRALFAAEFEGRYKDLRAQGLSEASVGSAAIDLPEASGQFSAAGEFLNTSEAEVLGRSSAGAGALAAAGFAIGGPVGAVVGGLLGVAYGLGRRGDLDQTRAKIRALLEPEMASYAERCEAEAMRHAREARKTLERALGRLVQCNLERYSATVERARAAHRARKRDLDRAIQQVDSDARALGRRLTALEELKERLLEIS